MRRFSRPVQLFIIAVMAGGATMLLATWPSDVGDLDLPFFAIFALSAILAGVYQIPLVHRHGMVNLTGGILLMAAYLAGPPMACLVSAVAALVSGVARRRRPWNILFMAGANVLSIGIAAGLYSAVAAPHSLPLDSWESALALLVSASCYWLMISAVTTVLVAARNNDSFSRTYLNNWREVYLQCILLTLLAVLGAAAWHQGMLYAFLLLVPAVAVYQLLSFNQMKQEQVIHAIEIIAEVLDRRNPFTFQHSLRVAEHVTKLARQLDLSPQDVSDVRRAALIHDIGKLGVDDPSEALPPGAENITDYQFYSLKQHAQLGAMISREIPAFEGAEEAICYHHDWYDGSHVSRNHAREEIPLGARLIGVADSYDRLCMSNGEAALAYDPIAVEQLRAMSGRQLDPVLLARFLALLEAEREALPARAPAASPATS